VKRGEAMQLTSLRAISNGALKGDTLPTRIKVLNWGENASAKGPVLFDEQSLASLAANQRELGFERVALDFEHNTVPGSEEYERTTEPRDVAAFGTVEAVAGDGLYLSALTWTPIGQAKARNYEDLSIAPKLDATSRVTFVHSAALTRNGAVYDLSFFKAAVPIAPSNPQPTPPPMPESTAPDMTALTQTLSARLDALEKRGVPDLAPVTEQIKTLSTNLETITLRVKAGEESVTAAEKDTLIKRFAADGKVPLGTDGKPLSDEDLKKLDLGTLKMLHANTAVTVPLSARASMPAQKPGPELKGLERVAAAIDKELAARGQTR
jgi:hypothetical protein